MTRALRIALALAASIAIGCGGSDDDSDGAPSGSEQSKATESSAASSGGKEPSSGDKELKIGEPGVVTYEDVSTDAKSKVRVTPKKLEKASIDEFADLDLEPSQKRSTPYYVEVGVTNVGSGDLSNTDPTISLLGVDGQGETQTSVTFLGDFEPCDSADAPKSLKKGESFDTCLVFLIPQGAGSLAGLEWADDDTTWKQ